VFQSDEPRKGFAYLTRERPYACPSLDAIDWRRRVRRQTAFRPIDGHWYLFLRYGDVSD
jgi:hypothetical protein